MSRTPSISRLFCLIADRLIENDSRRAFSFALALDRLYKRERLKLIPKPSLPIVDNEIRNAFRIDPDALKKAIDDLGYQVAYKKPHVIS